MELPIGLAAAEVDGSHLALLLLEVVLWVVQIPWPALLAVVVAEIPPLSVAAHQFMEAEVGAVHSALAEILFTVEQGVVVEFLYLAVTGESYRL
jgi:hypothetical protein